MNTNELIDFLTQYPNMPINIYNGVSGNIPLTIGDLSIENDNIIIQSGF